MDAAVRRVTGHPGFAARFKHPMKFNGTDFVEQRLTAEEQVAEVSKLASGKFHVFLERYGPLMSADELRALEGLPEADSAEARIWFGRLLREPLAGDQREKQRRRRRWAWAQREMARPDGFFSEEEMRQREPQLFQRVVGRHLDTKSPLSAPMQGSLSSYLMRKLEEECQASACGAVEDAAAAAEGATASAAAGQQPGGPAPGAAPDGPGVDDDEYGDAFFSGSDAEEAGDAKRRRLQAGGFEADDLAVRRAQFLKAMRDRFVDGRELHFDYAALDSDSDLDDLVELGRDAEDRYFDDE